MQDYKSDVKSGRHQKFKKTGMQVMRRNNANLEFESRKRSQTSHG